MRKLILLAILAIFMLPVFLQGFTYLSDAEYLALCGDERREYIAALEAEMLLLEARRLEAMETNYVLEPEVEELRRRLNEVNSEVASLENRRTTVVTTRSEIPEENVIRRNPDGEYVVRTGDSLWRIAGFDFIYNDNVRWPEIYRANQNQINNPDLIYPGQILVIPR